MFKFLFTLQKLRLSPIPWHSLSIIVLRLIYELEYNVLHNLAQNGEVKKKRVHNEIGQRGDGKFL